MSYSSYRLRLVVLLLLILPVFIISSSIRAEAANSTLEQDLQNLLLSSKTVIISAEDKISRGDSIVTEINRLKTLSKDIHVLHLLLIESFDLQKERIAALGTKAALRHSVMTDVYIAALKKYLSLIESLSSETLFSIEQLEQLKAFLKKNLPEKKRPIFGVLPYKSLNYPSMEPISEPMIRPAYKGGATITSGETMDPGPEDFEGTLEAPVTAEIATLAQSLNWNPVSIYEYVKNNIETQWYRGCMKGAEETLSQQSGNDCDQAALLVALYRAAGFRTRYIRGVIKFFPGIDSARNLTGLEDSEQIAKLFQKAGIPFTPVIEGGRIANFLIEHIWTEVYVPYENYRGAMLDDQGYEWVALDTSIKVKKYAENIPSEVFEDFLQENPLTGFRESYLESLNSETPLEFFKTSIQEYLDLNNPGMTYEELLGTRILMPEVMNILPMGLQFEPIAITGEYTAIPDELIHKVRFIANDNAGNLLLDITLSALEVSNQPVVLTYEAETVEDHEIIISYGGQDNTPAYLVRLRPVLKVGGERIILARDGLPMGSEYELVIELIGPNGTERITNTHVTGNLSVMGIVSQETVDRGEAEENAKTEEDAESLLYQSAISYISRWNQAEEELASLMHLKIARPIPTIVTLGGVIDVTYLLDTPHGFTWKGIYLDADLRAVEIVDSAQDTAASDKSFMQLSGLHGSVLESRVFEDDFQVASISTAKLLAIAGELGTQILTIDSANLDTLLPTLPFAANIKEDIINSVNQGFIISIPESEITYENWTGTGYIKENPFSGESGWMLSGMIAGSMNAGEWAYQYIKDILSSLYSKDVDIDPMSATRVIKIRATDMQLVTVGQAIKKPLSVLVLSRDGIPVMGAEVTFKVIAGGGSFNGSDTYTSFPTGYDGIAEVEPGAFTLGTKTSDNPNYMKIDSSDEYVTQVGLNLVTASVSGYIGEVWINEPLKLYGKPDKAFEIVKVFGDGAENLVNNPGGSLRIKVQDKYGNSISNKTVTFTALDAVQRPMWPDGKTALLALYGADLSFDLYTALVDKFYDYMSPVSPDDIASYLNSIASGLWNKEILPYLTSNCRNITFYHKDECEIKYPFYGECITQENTKCIIALDEDGNPVVERTGIDVTSRYYGVAVDTILGNTVGTKYTVEVSSTTLESVYLNLYTRGSRKSDITDQFKFLGNAVFIGGFEIFNENGEPVNAAKAGEELNAPLKTRLFVLYDEYTMEAGTAGYCPDLWRLRSLQTVKIEPASNGIVTYTPVAGGGRVVETINAGNGFYEARYETGSKPAVNRIDATGEATVTVPEVLSSYDEEWGLDIYRCYNSSTLPDNKVPLKTGQFVTFEWDTKVPYYYYDSNIVDTRVTNTVYGVDFVPCRNTNSNICAEEPGADIKIAPGEILLNEEGHTVTDTTFRYIILPPEYNALSAEIDLHEIDETTGKSWHGSLVGSSTWGEGGSVLVAGAKMFDFDKKYEAQVVLNRGSAAEIKSKRVEVKVTELKVLSDKGTDKVGEIKFSDGSRSEKTYHVELVSKSLVESCESISGTIRVIDKNGEPIKSLGTEYYPPEYALSFALSDGTCQVRLEDSGLAKQKFILSNMPKNALYLRLLEFYEFGTPVDLDKIAVLYGGIGNTLEININGAIKEIAVEPVGVIVIGIDGLRQDVLYPATRDGEDFENVQDSEDYYVDARDLNGLRQILLGNPEISSTQQYIMLPEVTAVFPSITLASWASIFTGKQPGETGILGNEFFARDLYNSATPNNQVIPGMQGLPSGMVTLSDGAFSNSSLGFLMYNLLPAHDYAKTVQKKIRMSSPNQLLSPAETTIPGAPTAQTIYEWLRDVESLQPYFRNPASCMHGGECRSAVFFNHYARGADWWGTIDLVWLKKIGVDIERVGELVREILGTPEKASKILDETTTDEVLDFLETYYPEDDSTLSYKRFPALFTVYYGGPDHYAHSAGMDERTENYTGYTDYFQKKTDAEISILVNKLKELGEFDNKIFIITSDHGHTAMATDLIYKREKTFLDPESSYEETIVDYPLADTSCSLKLDFQLDPDNPEAGRNNRRSEQANNNLHIWELGELFEALGNIQDTEIRNKYKILVPEKIEEIFKQKAVSFEFIPTSDVNEADVVVALNGPMAHIYSMVSVDQRTLGEIAETFRIMLGGFYPNEATTWLGFDDMYEYMEFQVKSIGRLWNSIDIILIRLENDKYYRFTGLDSSGNPLTINISTIPEDKYVDAVNRINKMNNKNRSGDIVLIMRTDVTIPQGENISDHRYTTGVSCKSWHGSLNRSDSYVPFIVSYPGGNDLEIDRVLKRNSLCKEDYSKCRGNWKLTDIVKELISEQFR